MEAKGSSKMLITIYQTTWHHIPKDGNLQRYFSAQAPYHEDMKRWQ
jgi:hypothetical protein